MVISLKVEVKPWEGMRRGQGHSLGTIIYGSTKQESKRKQETKEEHPGEILGKPRGKMF